MFNQKNIGIHTHNIISEGQYRNIMQSQCVDHNMTDQLTGHYFN